jgi:hypothetical protein
MMHTVSTQTTQLQAMTAAGHAALAILGAITTATVTKIGATTAIKGINRCKRVA